MWSYLDLCAGRLFWQLFTTPGFQSHSRAPFRSEPRFKFLRRALSTVSGTVEVVRASYPQWCKKARVQPYAEKISPSPTLNQSKLATSCIPSDPFIFPSLPKILFSHLQRPVECLHGRPTTFLLHRLGHRHETTRFLSEQRLPRPTHGNIMENINSRSL